MTPTWWARIGEEIHHGAHCITGKNLIRHHLGKGLNGWEWATRKTTPQSTLGFPVTGWETAMRDTQREGEQSSTEKFKLRMKRTLAPALCGGSQPSNCGFQKVLDLKEQALSPTICSSNLLYCPYLMGTVWLLFSSKMGMGICLTLDSCHIQEIMGRVASGVG